MENCDTEDIVQDKFITYFITSKMYIQVCHCDNRSLTLHYNDDITGKMASQITSLTIVYLTVYLSADLRKHQSSAPLAFVRGIHRGPVNSPHKGPVTRKMFPFDDVIMQWLNCPPVLKFWIYIVEVSGWMLRCLGVDIPGALYDMDVNWFFFCCCSNRMKLVTIS